VITSFDVPITPFTRDASRVYVPITPLDVPITLLDASITPLDASIMLLDVPIIALDASITPLDHAASCPGHFARDASRACMCHAWFALCFYRFVFYYRTKNGNDVNY
jgi:hypothetical protein